MAKERQKILDLLLSQSGNPVLFATGLLWLLLYCTARAGIISLATGTVGALVAMVAAVCGLQWADVMRIVREILQDYYAHTRSLQKN